MIKLLITGRCAPHQTRQDALAHMSRVHGPLVYDPPADAGPMPAAYGQNHGLDPRPPLAGLGPTSRDFVTEVWFQDPAHLRAATTTPYYQQVLRPDELNFVDPASVLVIASRPGEPSGAEPLAAVRLFLFLQPLPGQAVEFAARHDRLLTAARAHPAVCGWVSDQPLPSPDGQPPRLAAIERLSFADRAAADRFLADQGPVIAAGFAGVLDPQDSGSLLADHYPVARLTALRS